ncbi:MAG: hypothetical protein QOG41_1074 [Thermoleophilaceae bacterium]|nr:hypothetical protein [Thermoleophilaceae bacterium]
MAAASLALLAGCGGDRKTATTPAGTATTKTPAAAAPKANGALEDAAKDLERAVASGDCRALAARLLHSSARGPNVDPADPPTAAECDRLASIAKDVLEGFRVRRVQQFGPAGIVEGSGANTRRGEVVATAWELDRDGSWKADVMGFFAPQIGTRPKPGTDFEASVRRFVTAAGEGDCDTFWRLLHPASRFVAARRGDQAKLCNDVADSYRKHDSALHDIAADRSARPEELGKTLDMGFYGLALRSGRYMVFVAWTKLRGHVAYAKGHSYPAIVDYLTLRKPTG